MNIDYPADLAMKIIKNEGSGDEPHIISLVAPTIVRPDEKFTLKIALVDAVGLVVVNYMEYIEVMLGNMKAKISFLQDLPALVELQELTITEEGFYRFEAKLNGITFYSNPVYCSKTFDSKIFWGDPHIHTVLSNCNAPYSHSISFGFNAARHLSCLDWASAADHVSNGRCELARWKEQVAASNAYNDEGTFVTLPAYEASLDGGCGGDNNVYLSDFPSLFIDDYENGNSKTLAAKLADLAKKEEFDFFLVPHHTTRTIKHGEISDEIYPGDEQMPLVEIHSKWGTSEYRGNPMALLDVHDGPAFAVDLLATGKRFGFVGGTDTHYTLTFTAPELEHPISPSLPGITATRCETLTRNNIFTSMKNRNCYAAAGERTFLDVKINNASMGTTIKDDKTPRSIEITVAGKGDIESIDVIRNGETLKTFAPDFWNFKNSFEDTDDLQEIALSSNYINNFIYYYVRVVLKSGARAWSSPIWITA